MGDAGQGTKEEDGRAVGRVTGTAVYANSPAAPFFDVDVHEVAAVTGQTIFHRCLEIRASVDRRTVSVQRKQRRSTPQCASRSPPLTALYHNQLTKGIASDHLLAAADRPAGERRGL